MRGFSAAHENLVKSSFEIIKELKNVSLPNTSFTGIIKAAPKLRVLEIGDHKFEVRFFFFSSFKRANRDICLQPMVDALSSFKDINTIIIRPLGSRMDLSQCIEATKQRLKDLAPSKPEERRYIRVRHESYHFSSYLIDS